MTGRGRRGRIGARFALGGQLQAVATPKYAARTTKLTTKAPKLPQGLRMVPSTFRWRYGVAVVALGPTGMMAGKKAGTCRELEPCPTDTHAAIYLARYLWMGSGAGDFNTRICPSRTTPACGLDW